MLEGPSLRKESLPTAPTRTRRDALVVSSNGQRYFTRCVAINFAVVAIECCFFPKEDKKGSTARRSSGKYGKKGRNFFFQHNFCLFTAVFTRIFYRTLLIVRLV